MLHDIYSLFSNILKQHKNIFLVWFAHSCCLLTDQNLFIFLLYPLYSILFLFLNGCKFFYSSSSLLFETFCGGNRNAHGKRSRKKPRNIQQKWNNNRNSDFWQNLRFFDNFLLFFASEDLTLVVKFITMFVPNCYKYILSSMLQWILQRMQFGFPHVKRCGWIHYKVCWLLCQFCTSTAIQSGQSIAKPKPFCNPLLKSIPKCTWFLPPTISCILSFLMY